MTRQEFTLQFRHEVEGWLLDAAMTQRSGADLSVWLRMMRARIEVKMGAMYDALCPLLPKPEQPRPAANGQAKAITEVKK